MFTQLPELKVSFIPYYWYSVNEIYGKHFAKSAYVNLADLGYLSLYFSILSVVANGITPDVKVKWRRVSCAHDKIL